MSKRVFNLINEQVRRSCQEHVWEVPDGYKVVVTEPAKTRDQEERYHAMLGDIAEQLTLHGKKWDAESIKRICVDQFRRDTAKDPDLAELWKAMGTMEMCPSMDGTGVVALGWQTRRFPKRLATAFIEWLFALGAEVEIQWTEPRKAA